MIYTHEMDLDTDLMMTCSTMNGVAAWRQVMTMEGVICKRGSCLCVLPA